MTYNRKTKLYRNKREGRVLGVCAGIADYFDIDVTLVRVVMIFATLFSGIFPLVLVYVILGVALDDKPNALYADKHEEEFWRQTRREPEETSTELKKRFKDIERRTAEMEAYMTSKRFKLERELRDLENT